jgi:hypothetical protein
MGTARHSYGSNQPEYGPGADEVLWRYTTLLRGHAAERSSTRSGRTTTSSRSARDAIDSLMAAKHGIEALSLTGLLLAGLLDRYIEARTNTYPTSTLENPDDRHLY